MKKILNIFLFCILGIIIVFNMISIVSIKVLHKNYINFFGYTYFEVQTGSMLPAIKPNDVIIVKINDIYKENDIITYYDENSFVTHRIVTIDGDSYTTKGDANDVNDKPIKKDQIIGSVIKVLGSLGIITKILQNPITLIIIFAIGILIISLTSFKSKEKE